MGFCTSSIQGLFLSHTTSCLLCKATPVKLRWTGFHRRQTHVTRADNQNFTIVSVSITTKFAIPCVYHFTNNDIDVRASRARPPPQSNTSCSHLHEEELAVDADADCRKNARPPCLPPFPFLLWPPAADSPSKPSLSPGALSSAYDMKRSMGVG